ncbi:MAG TPA: family 20 glycosylhydrolase [bacterium]|nr:family 20 glycosylhydrolase [bacterium]
MAPAAGPASLILPAPFFAEARPGSVPVPRDAPVKLTGYARDPAALLGPLAAAGLAVSPAVEPAGPRALIIGRPKISALTRLGRALNDLLTAISDARVREQAYVIEAGDGAAAVMAGGEPGLFYGALTLAGLVSEGALPCVRIQDRPALPSRAVLLDISRGRVPRLSALKEFTDLIVALKYNQLLFNIEHVMDCPARPEIGAGRGALVPSELKELDNYAHDRCVEIIPFQQSLGHLRGIVSLPEYRGLAYDSELLWSLDPAKAGTYELLADLYDTQISATRSSLFHAGCDEPFDIMKKHDPARFGGRTLGAVVRDHLIRLHGMIQDRGRTMMAWADAVVAHPEIIPDLPQDLVLCHWLYGSGNLEDPDHYRPGLEAIASAGLPFYACTSSWSLMKIFPDLAVMRANHESFIPLAKKMGAEGIMLTIWGDMGHMNLTGLETYPLACAARHAWEDSPDPAADIGRAYAGTVFRDRDGLAAGLALTLDRVNSILKGPAGMAGVGFLLFFAEPLSTAFSDATVKDYSAAAAELKEVIRKARDILAQLEERDTPRRRLWLDHHLAALQIELLARKLSLAAFLKSGWPAGAGESASRFMEDAAARCRDAAQLVCGCLALLESRWLAQNRESDLEVNRTRYRRLISAWLARAVEFRRYAEKIRGGENPPPLDSVLLTPPSGYSFNPLLEMGLIGLL